jgi:hypothetical protein
MEKPKQQGPDITDDVHMHIGMQTTQILSLRKERDGLLKMCAAFEKELNEFKEAKKVK